MFRVWPRRIRRESPRGIRCDERRHSGDASLAEHPHSSHHRREHLGGIDLEAVAAKPFHQTTPRAACGVGHEAERSAAPSQLSDRLHRAGNGTSVRVHRAVEVEQESGGPRHGLDVSGRGRGNGRGGKRVRVRFGARVSEARAMKLSSSAARAKLQRAKRRTLTLLPPLPLSVLPQVLLDLPAGHHRRVLQPLLPPGLQEPVVVVLAQRLPHHRVFFQAVQRLVQVAR